VKHPNPPWGIREAAEDPLLPFVVAAKAGDRSAERELLSRLAPTALAVARAANAGEEPIFSTVVLDSLVATLKALPTFRGDEIVKDAVARIALEKSRLALGSLGLEDDQILLAATAQGARTGDGSRIAALVDRALQDDAAVLVSQIVLRKAPKRTKKPVYGWRAWGLGALAIVGAAWLAGRLLSWLMP
jgi:hypothetical protein